MVAALLLGGRHISAGAVMVCAVLMAIGTLCWAMFWINVSLLSFWWSSADPVQGIVGGLRDAGQYPQAAFRGSASLVFAAVIPATLLGAIPASGLAGKLSASTWVICGVLPLFGSLVTAAHWRLALRRYDSASS